MSILIAGFQNTGTMTKPGLLNVRASKEGGNQLRSFRSKPKLIASQNNMEKWYQSEALQGEDTIGSIEDKWPGFWVGEFDIFVQG